MAVGSICTFDRWQKDEFFSAAEAVQDSADILESVYRMWMRYRSDGFDSEISGELLRELRTALSTAKWQLEEFERAVSLSHNRSLAEENTISRHREFIDAIGNQVFHIEKELSDSLIGEGKQPLRWVQLNDEERDDLAIFLSAAPYISQEIQDKHMVPNQSRIKPDSINKESEYVVATEKPFKSKGDVIAREEQLEEQKRTCSSPDITDWKIIIADDQDADRKMIEMRSVKRNRASSLYGFLNSVESAAKAKWTRNSFPKAKSGEHLELCDDLEGINQLNERGRSCFASCNRDTKVSSVQQPVGRVGGLQRHIQGSRNYLQFGRSLRFVISLLLIILLTAPFLLYSS